MRLDPAKLKQARTRAAMSQERLARRCELSRKSIQRAELGETVRPETAALVAAALGVALDEIRLAAGGAEAGGERPEQRLTLRRAKSGTRVFETLAQSYAGRIGCDVEASGETIGPLTGLVASLGRLVADAWGRGPMIPPDLPMVDRLRIIAELNDALRALERHGIGCFIGHYYRYVVAGRGAVQAPGDAPGGPVMLARIQLSDCPRDALQVTIDQQWSSQREGAAAPPAFGDDERFVFLESRPPLTPALEDTAGEVIEGAFSVRVA
ncbi:MAG TPA: helix-turn-helix domain-containing protein [Phenylobacterium sp.]|uniref:helix-turn-helix transcriptional regulator n=1 Tax=Phenylobacterium sp. TaxID=1871053 RepID=UPI002C44153E|nr:helix-turn-helix domain-containing protein [Phenylobacterium sp.]HSV02670.1 helix-turn-helix domain-containing protein [Phenylobacterium sp.]